MPDIIALLSRSSLSGGSPVYISIEVQFHPRNGYCSNIYKDGLLNNLSLSLSLSLSLCSSPLAFVWHRFPNGAHYALPLSYQEADGTKFDPDHDDI